MPETACGFGSTMKATADVRAELRPLLDRLGVKSLLDAPCGDFNWMREVDLSGIAYTGADYSAVNLDAARRRGPGLTFLALDIVGDALPETDAVLCRDFLQHLPTTMAIKALANISRGAKWLLATSHDVARNADIATPGDFRPLNLQAAPFKMGEPAFSIPDGKGRIIGAWAL